MPNYKDGKIYKIYSLSNPDLVYVGSTTQPLSKRLADHRGQYKRYQKGKGCYTSYKIFEGCDDYRIELIEFCPCNSKMELHRTEGKYIREMDCVNKVVAGRTGKEYRQANRDKIKQYQRVYQQANRDKIKQSNKEYRQTNRDKIKQYRQDNKQRRKQYYQDNKQRWKQYYQDNRQYYQVNKDKLKARMNIKITCECGSIVSRRNISTHRKSKKHQRLMNQQ